MEIERENACERQWGKHNLWKAMHVMLWNLNFIPEDIVLSETVWSKSLHLETSFGGQERGNTGDVAGECEEKVPDRQSLHGIWVRNREIRGTVESWAQIEALAPPLWEQKLPMLYFRKTALVWPEMNYHRDPGPRTQLKVYSDSWDVPIYHLFCVPALALPFVL